MVVRCDGCELMDYAARAGVGGLCCAAKREWWVSFRCEMETVGFWDENISFLMR